MECGVHGACTAPVPVAQRAELVPDLGHEPAPTRLQPMVVTPAPGTVQKHKHVTTHHVHVSFFSVPALVAKFAPN